MEEYLDILDEDGTKTGESATYFDAHKYGLIHKAVHVWIINSNQEILLQKRGKTRRAYPNYWDISAAGHVSTEESSIDAAKRETKEELGIDLSDDELIFLGIVEEHIVLNEGAYINNEFQDVYMVRKNIAVEEIKFDPGEVEQVRWITMKEFQQWTQGKGEILVPHKEEHSLLLGELGFK